MLKTDEREKTPTGAIVIALTEKERQSFVADPTWQRCASVTTGGKPWFWHRQTEFGQQWIAWNRAMQTWQQETEHWTRR